MGRLAFITGASSGIGQALAARYYVAGYDLALVARRTADIQAWALAQGLEAGRWRVYGADVSVIDSIADVGRACIAAQGLPDVVIANAGISVGVDTAIREDIDVVAQTFATNVTGLAATFQPFVSGMVERRSGVLVGIASVSGIRGLPGHAAYCASKAAAISYCESLRGDMRRATGVAGVKVVTLCPGYIDTPLTRENRYSMPFLMKPDAFAAHAFRAISTGASYRVIPWQMGVVAKILRALPNPVFDRVFAGRARKHRKGEGRT